MSRYLGRYEYWVVIFDDGQFFAGVKGKCVRKTANYLDAKRCGMELSDRDSRYLNDFNYELQLIRVEAWKV